ncbi:transcriptional regulator, TetR family [Desulfovibrio sp. X2]|uniref:CerR family C-terminal domain-containing protein n=1 Tax=Desulfovibrio sp. X2 TaxID=941449 RepID=UPI0003588AE5|nr:CerR family C-terminal domain-containing protein [Desulfovibrio sp. X2]EPR38720.1 transcriptional regulator, TetR family [Desulfovibrio sp. X2]
MARRAQPDTRQRIIEAAGRVFSDKGFHRATVRGICSRAGVNVALIKYHFGGKEGLYREVLGHAFGRCLREFPPDTALADTPPEERIAIFVRGHLARIREKRRISWEERLLRREFFEASPTMEDMVRSFICPVAELLNRAVGELLGLPPSDLDVIRCSLSVVGQCLHHYYSLHTISALYSEMGYSPAEIDALAEHITHFSLAGIKGVLARRKAGDAALVRPGGKTSNRPGLGASREAALAALT